MLSSEINEYLNQLCWRHSGVREIWLFGSRANGTETEGSDWDFFIFGTSRLLEALVKDSEIRRANIDVHVVDESGGTYNKPWRTAKNRNFADWQWNQISETEANYLEKKWMEDEAAKAKGRPDMGTVVKKERRAYRVWPKSLTQNDLFDFRLLPVVA